MERQRMWKCRSANATRHQFAVYHVARRLSWYSNSVSAARWYCHPWSSSLMVQYWTANELPKRAKANTLTVFQCKVCAKGECDKILVMRNWVVHTWDLSFDSVSCQLVITRSWSAKLKIRIEMVVAKKIFWALKHDSTTKNPREFSRTEPSDCRDFFGHRQWQFRQEKLLIAAQHFPKD